MAKKLLSPEDVLDRLARRYANSQQSWLAGEGEWPLCISLGQPTERDYAADAAGVRAWVESWSRWSGDAVLEWETRKWASLGTQRLPYQILVESPAAVTGLLGAGPEARWRRATGRYAEMRRLPGLAGRVELTRLFDVLADYEPADFARLVDGLTWFFANPASGYYLRQVPIEGLDTKWLEKRTGLIIGLLALMQGVEPALDIYEACGLTRMPYRIRIKVLCPEMRAQVGGLCDLEAPIEDVAKLPLKPNAVLVVENQQNGVALPDMPGVVAFMRMGNAVGALRSIPWLSGTPAVYWGDLDTHGLAILAVARRALPQVRSVLMDVETLLTHRALWGTEPVQHSGSDISSLTDDEKALFATLRNDGLAPKVRLEQERLSWPEALAAVRGALNEAVASACACRYDPADPEWASTEFPLDEKKPGTGAWL